MGMHKKEKFWKNSLWILWTFSIVFYWVAFFYIGIRARYRRWIWWGVIYSIPFALLMVFSPDSTIGNYLTNLAIGAWIASIIHGFAVRREYLVRMKVREELLQQEEELLRRKILGVDGENLLSKVPSPPSPFASSDPASAPERAVSPFPDRHAPGDTALIDLNRASEEQIASLPGINLIMAKRAVSLRDARGGFDSLEDFSHALGLKPHIKERIRPMVTVGPKAEDPTPSGAEREGGFGRIVDY